MKTKSRLTLPLLLLTPVLLGGNWVGDKPTFQPKSGTAITKHVAIENELELEDMSMEVNGVDMSEMAGQVEMAMKVTMKLTVTDTYEAVAGERPAKLKRSFEEISSNTHVSGSNPAMGAEEKDIPLASELEGATVVFAWDDGDGAYRVSFDGDQEGDAELLEDLEENLDLRGFLPSAEVAEGDSWKVSAEAVRAALAPGGDIKLRPEGETNPMGGMDQFSQNDMIGDLDGEFQASYAGTRQEDGVKVAVIKLTIDAKSAQDMSARLAEIKEQMKGNLPDGVEIDISALDGEYAYEAEGELLWNLESGLIHGLSLSGEVRMIVDMAMGMKMGDEEQSMDISQTFAGNQTITLTTGE